MEKFSSDWFNYTFRPKNNLHCAFQIQTLTEMNASIRL